MHRPLYFLKHHKRRLLLLIITLIILGVILWPRSVKQLETQAVKRGDIVESISATGTVNATSVDLTFLIPGKLVYLGVKKGDQVKKGQVIATIDQQTLQKNLETKLRDYSLKRNEFDQTQSDNLNRTPLEALNDDMKRILQDNQYDLDKAVISVELQDLAKQQSVLTTPIAGVVTQTDVTTAGVNIGLTTTFTVSDLTSTTFDIDIDEADIGKVNIGFPVKITLDAFPDQALNVTVQSIDFVAHATSTGGNVYTVQTTLPQNTKFVYRVGMNGDAEIITNKKQNVINIPISSVLDDTYVFVKTNRGFEKRTVKLGLINDTDAEIISGLNQGEEVALDPTEAEKQVKK